MSDPNENVVRVLLVEDNIVHVHLLRDLLKDARSPSFALVHAGTLEAGIAKLKQEPCDLVLLDLTLPDSRDLDTFVRVRAHAPHVPIVIVTALDDLKLAAKAVEAGAQDYLVKTQLDKTTLARSLRYAFERTRVRDAEWDSPMFRLAHRQFLKAAQLMGCDALRPRAGRVAAAVDHRGRLSAPAPCGGPVPRTDRARRVPAVRHDGDGGISAATAVAGRDVDGRVGPAMQGVAVAVRPGGADEDLGPGTGRLFVRSSSMTTGYLDDTGAMRVVGEEGRFETGDRVRLEADGAIHLHGRTTEFVNVADPKVVPCEVEDVILGLSGGRESMVYAGEHVSGTQVVKASVAVEPPLAAAEVRAHCARHLVHSKRPQVVETLPRTPSGKIVRGELSRGRGARRLGAPRGGSHAAIGRRTRGRVRVSPHPVRADFNLGKVGNP